MKKILFIVMAVMVAFSVSAQKMEIKKGEIQFDKVAVAKIEKQKNSNGFLFSDLNGTPLFTASEEKTTSSGIILPNTLLLLTGNNGNEQEISTKDIKVSFTFSNDNRITQLVINCGADLITSQGINQDKINEFFKTSNRSVSNAYIALIEQAKAGLTGEDELANSINLTIKGTRPGVGDILANGKKIGNISVEKDGKNSSVYNYRISELNNIFIASMAAYETTQPRTYQTKTYDDKIFPVFSEKGMSFLISKDENAQRMVRKLYFEGYTLGDMKEFFEEKQKAEEEALRAEEEALIAASGNIYEKQGYVIEKNGKKTEGLITLEFMPKSDALGKTESSMGELEKYGKQVIVKTGNETDFYLAYDRNKGKTVAVMKELAFSASDGVRVVVDSIQYLGVAGGLMGFGRETFFYRIVYEKDENMVLKEHKRDNVMLKLANQKKPKDFNSFTLLGKKNTEKMKKEFDDYVNCPALNYSDYVTYTVDGLTKLVEDYVEKCKEKLNN